MISQQEHKNNHVTDNCHVTLILALMSMPEPLSERHCEERSNPTLVIEFTSSPRGFVPRNDDAG
jgi:hypothetical protein